MEVGGSSVLITGASSGIGAALAIALAGQGCSLAIAGRDEARLEAVAEDCRALGSEVATWAADLGDYEAVDRLGDEAWDRFDGIDVLVNNAAMPKRRHVLALDTDEVEEVMRVNFHSPVRLATRLLPRMIERGRGCLVNVSSLGGRMGILNETAYSASKFALTGWTEAAAMDLWDQPVDVRLITPGAIDTAIWERPDNDPASFDIELEPPETVAAAIIGAIESGPFETYTPDMSAVVEFKMSDLDAFQAATVAAAETE